MWPEAIGALVLLSERFPEPVWLITSRQLITASTRDSGLYVSRKPEWAEVSSEKEIEIAFEEQELRCHHLEELRAIVNAELRLFEGGVDSNTEREKVLIAVRIFHLFDFI